MKKRLFSGFLALMMVFTLVNPMVFTVRADENIAEGTNVQAEDTESTYRNVQAEEVSGTPRLDAISGNVGSSDADRPASYRDDEMVTIIVELEEAPLMDAYAMQPYTVGDDSETVGEAVSQFLASDEAMQAADELRNEQLTIFNEIQAMQPATMSADETSSSVTLTAQWTVLLNGMAVRAPYGMLDAVKSLDGVKRAYVEHTYDEPDEPVTDAGDIAGYSYDMVHLNEAWEAGYTGKGLLVAVLDTGVDIESAAWYDDEKNENVFGIRRIHEAFRDNSFKTDVKDSELRYTKSSLLNFLSGRKLNANSMSAASNADMYKTRKVPFAFDYAGETDSTTGEIIGGDVNVRNTSSDHGTHVSGTIAGYAEDEEGQVLFSGVAPDAQIIMMKVFADVGGGATDSSILKALEDTMVLGADIVNLSLGSDNGFAKDDTVNNEVYARMEQAGIILMTSAGNSETSPSMGNELGGLNESKNPDISVISSPAVYASNLAVASVNSTVDLLSILKWNGNEVGYSDPTSIAMKSKFAGKGEFAVYDAGYGTYDDYYKAGFDTGYNGGKTGIALVKRGGTDSSGNPLSFVTKINNANSFSGVNSHGDSYGVLAVIIYDSDDTKNTLINMSTDGTSLTSAFIGGKDGAQMIAAINSGETVKISVEQDDKVVAWDDAGNMSSFTSWGAGASLELKPEITAPGGNIWSTIVDQTYQGGAGIYDDYNGSYGMMSGTSMAAPHMSGLAAVVRQYVDANIMPSGADKHDNAEVASKLLVSTAVPTSENGVFVSPRRQGAGIVNVAAAIKTPAYINVDGKLVGKLELGDDVEWSGSYDLEFEVVNISDKAQTYNVSASLLRPDTTEQDGMTMVLEQDVLIKNVDLGTVTVPAYGRTTVSKNVSLTADEISAIKALFPNGTFVEGFIKLTSEDSSVPQIGLPMLAFLGDWTAAPIFDEANWFDEPEDGSDVNNNHYALGVNVMGSTVQNNGEVVNFINVGQNPFGNSITETSTQTVFHKGDFTISPNGDGYLDSFDDLELYQLRDAKLIVSEVHDKETGELYYRDFLSYMPRSVYNSNYGVVIPYTIYYFTNGWKGTDLEGNILPSGTECVYSIVAYGDGDYGDKIYNDEAGRDVTDFESFKDGKEPTFNGHAMDKTGDTLTFDVLVDTEAPKLVNNSVSFYEKDGRTYMTGTVEDGNGSIASIEVDAQVSRTYTDSNGKEVTEYGIDMTTPFMEETIYDEDTHTFTFTADVTEYKGYMGEWTGNVFLSCGDYGANDRTYAIRVNAEPGLVLSQTSALLYPGQEFDLSVNNNTDSDAAITRTSSNPEVATVDEFGHVKAIAPGQAVITVSNGDTDTICIIAVKERPTQVEDFSLSMENFDGLKPNGSITVKVENIIPADVQIDDITWKVYEDDEDWAGLVDVYKDSSDALSGRIELTATASSDLIPGGAGYLEVTINGVSRKMRFSWDNLYTSSTQDDLKSDAYYNEQTVYVETGKTATLVASYLQNHSFVPIKLYTAEGFENYGSNNPTTDAEGLVLDAPSFASNNTTWTGKIVNKENYALPETIHVVYRYDGGYETELTLNSQYNGYTYDNKTGEISFLAPMGSSATVVIRADGVKSEGTAAGKLSGNEYTQPDGTYGPFDWTLTEGDGKLETAENVNVNYSTKNVAYFTPSKPGVSYLTATTKDGKYSVNFAVVSTPVKAESIKLDANTLELTAGDTHSLSATLAPTPSLDSDAGLTWVSYNPEVATVDENGVVTANKAGYAFISVYTTVDSTVTSYCMVEVKKGPHVHNYSDTWTTSETKHWHACLNEDCDEPVIDEAEHTVSDWIIDKEATIVEEGLRHKECTVCHYIIEKEKIEKVHVHEFDKSWTTSDTEHWHVCKSDDGAVSDKAAHTASDWIVDRVATYEVEGLKHKECTVCGYVMETENIPTSEAKHEHKFSDNWSISGTEHWHACTEPHCDGTVSDKGAHTPSDWIIVKDATTESDGMRQKVCTVCGFITNTQVIPKLSTKVNGWDEDNGMTYWYENGVRQGFNPDDESYRGKEIYDPESDAWYWLDAAQNGAITKGKDVYQESLAGDWGDTTNENGEKTGKWVRYDADGHMVKGWDETSNGTYYFDSVFGTMAKGDVVIDGKNYTFDVITGILISDENGKSIYEDGFHTVNGVNYWYENGVRQGFDAVDIYFRGKEIYDPESDAWYWLDNIDNGAVAVSKDVYQESLAGQWGDSVNADGEKIGKWVRYDENGHMVKGWDEKDGNVYYFDPIFGTMAKGEAVIDGQTYYFDTITGIRR